MDPIISIIIPIYKSEKFIEKCSRSLFEQTLNNIEFIFINDSTPDISISLLYNIIDHYPNREEKFKIIKSLVSHFNGTLMILLYRKKTYIRKNALAWTIDCFLGRFLYRRKMQFSWFTRSDEASTFLHNRLSFTSMAK